MKERRRDPYETGEGIGIAEVAKHLDRDRSAINRTALKAIEKDYLVDENPGKGRTSMLRLGKMELPSGSALPSPEELFEKPKKKVHPF